MLDLDQDNLHHAILISGEIDVADAAVASFLENDLDVELSGNPDVMRVHEERLGIDTARKLRSSQQQRGFVRGGRSIYLVAFEQITEPAQNALLKSLEEPTEDTHFFLMTPNTSHLLPTLLSRVELVKLEDEDDSRAAGSSISAAEFLKAAPPKRLDLVADIVEEKRASAARSFVNSLEEILYESNGARATGLEEIQMVQQYIGNTGASLKQLLHHLCITLPQLDT